MGSKLHGFVSMTEINTPVHSCLDCGCRKRTRNMQKVSFNCTKMVENDFQIKLAM